MKKVITHLTSLLIAVGLLASCGSSVDPASETKYASSDDGTRLIAVEGKEEGICILQSSFNDSNDLTARLLTERGSLRADQVYEALEIMTQTQESWQWLSSYTVGVVGGLLGYVYGLRRVNSAGRRILGMVLVQASGMAVGWFGHMVAVAMIKGEKWNAAFMDNDTRLTKLLSETDQLNISPKRMQWLIRKFSNTFPPSFHLHQCDHLK